MKIELQGVNKKEHRLTVTRQDGSVDSALCETRSLLKHDLMHYALEASARLDSGFWGMLASGKSLSELSDRSSRGLSAYSSEIMVIEAIVGALQGLHHSVPADQFLQRLNEQGPGLGFSIPSWLTVDTVRETKRRFQALNGQWRSTKFGEAMSLVWSNKNSAL